MLSFGIRLFQLLSLVLIAVGIGTVLLGFSRPNDVYAFSGFAFLFAGLFGAVWAGVTKERRAS